MNSLLKSQQDYKVVPNEKFVSNSFRKASGKKYTHFLIYYIPFQYIFVITLVTIAITLIIILIIIILSYIKVIN